MDFEMAMAGKGSKPTTTKCFQQHRDNAASEDTKSNWQRSVAVPVMDNFTVKLSKRLSYRSQTNNFV